MISIGDLIAVLSLTVAVFKLGYKVGRNCSVG